MHNLIKSKLDAWAQEDESYGYGPQGMKKLNAVSCESKTPIGKNRYEEKIFNCTEWDNGEGFDIAIYTHNQLSMVSKNKVFSIGSTDIEGILACLKELKYFG